MRPRRRPAIRASSTPRSATQLGGRSRSLLRRLIDAGVRLTGASDHGVSEALYLNDPDGNGLELYWDRPQAKWPRPPDGGDGVAMYTAPLDLQDLLAQAADT